MPNNNTWRKGRSVVYNNTVHLVFVTKYRRKVFSDFLLPITEAVIKETCQQMECELLEFNGEENHIHIIISLHPKHALSNVVGKLKGKSAYILRRDHFDHIKHVLWGKHFWSPSYCAVSTGGASLEIIANYIKGQSRPS
jgi:putative transposase